MACPGHQWLFDSSDDTGRMRWHCKNCGETSTSTPKQDKRDVPGDLAEENVTEEDVAYWNGLSWWGKRHVKASEAASTSAWVKEFERQGVRSPEIMLRSIYKVTPQYADFSSKEDMVQLVLMCERLGYSANDFPLPWQLQKRCSEFTCRCFENGMSNWFRESAAKFNTMNAFFRAQIKEGRV